jgi:hypothetical protein
MQELLGATGNVSIENVIQCVAADLAIAELNAIVNR